MSCHLECKFLLHVLRFIKIIGFNSIMKNFQLSKVYRFKVIRNHISNCQFCPLQLLRKWCICKNKKWRQSINWTSKENIGLINQIVFYNEQTPWIHHYYSKLTYFQLYILIIRIRVGFAWLLWKTIALLYFVLHCCSW